MATNKPSDNPRINKLIELEVSGRIKPEHQSELDTYRAQGFAPKSGAGKLTETEGKTTGFYGRALDADNEFLSSGYGDKPRGVLGQAATVLPEGITNQFESTGRQLSEQAKKNFISASLRLESGALISPEEFALQDSIFFPQPGNPPEVIAQKAAARKRVIDGFRIGAGAGAAEVERYRNEATPPPPPETREIGADEALSRLLSGDGPSTTVDVVAPSIPPEVEARFRQMQADPNVTGDQLRQFLDQNAPGWDTQEQQYAPGAREMAAQLDEAQGEAGLGTLARQGMAPLSDEAAGVGNAIANVLTPGFGSDFDPIGAYRTGRDAERIRLEEARARTGGAGTAFELAGSLGMLRPGRPLAGSLMRQGAIGGGVAGGITGFGQGEGIESLAAAGQGAAGGAIVGGALGRLGDRMTRPPTPPGGQDAMDLAQVAQQEGVPVSRPILDDAARDRMAFLESSPGSGNRVRQGLEATREGIEQRAGQLGAGGTAEEAGTLGQRIQNAGQRYIDRTRNIVSRAYDRAAQMAGNNTVAGREAVNRLDANIADLAQSPNTNAAEIAYLQSLRADFVDDAGNLIPKSVGAIRDMRTNMRGQISQRNLTHSSAERRVGEVLDAARGDIARDLGQSAPAAVRQYTRADRMHRERMSEIKQVVQDVIGPRDNPISGQKVMAKIRAMAGPKGDSGRLQRVMAKLTPEERLDVAATIAESLGRNAPEEAFSPALFVRQVRTLSPAARRSIFGDEGARSIANLRALSEAYRDTVGRLNNSRSGMVQNWGQFLRQFSGGGTLGAIATAAGGGGALATGGAGIALGAASAGVGALSRNLSARSLMSPDVSRWLAAAAQQNTPRAIGTHIERLGTLAARNPVIANDVLGLQSQLRQAFAQNLPVNRVAAEESEDGR